MNLIKKICIVSLLFFSFLQSSLSNACLKDEGFTGLLSGLQASECFNYIKYGTSLAVAAYPLYHGYQSIKQVFFDIEPKGYNLEAVKKLKTHHDNDISHLGNLIKEVAQTLEIPDKKLSKIRFHFYNEHISGNSAMATNRSVYLYSSFFKLSYLEQAHTVGHELTHLMENHKIINGICNIAIPLVSYMAAESYIKFLMKVRDLEKHELPIVSQLFISGIIPYLTLGMTRMLSRTLSNYLEKRADLKSARSLKNALGGVSAYNPWKPIAPQKNKKSKGFKKKTSNESEENLEIVLQKNKNSNDYPRWVKIDNYLNTFYMLSSHPSHLERHLYLSERFMELEQQERLALHNERKNTQTISEQ